MSRLSRHTGLSLCVHVRVRGGQGGRVRSQGWMCTMDSSKETVRDRAETSDLILIHTGERARWGRRKVVGEKEGGEGDIGGRVWVWVG